MNLDPPLPLWILRHIVRENPWLVSDDGTVHRSAELRLGPVSVTTNAEGMLRPRAKARLQAEADAGTLFGTKRQVHARGARQE